MIHQSAVVSPNAKIGNNVAIGPFCFIGDKVEIGDGVIIHSHVVITGKTKIGSNCQIFPFASIGHNTQDLKYKGEESSIEIGHSNSIREYVTIHPGTEGGGMITKIGNNNLLMVGVHIAHDCIIGNNVIFANLVTVAGHVVVGDHVVIGGLSAVHQFARIGDQAMIGGCCGIERDIAPFASVSSERGGINGINILGLKRRGVAKDDILALQQVFKLLFFSDRVLDDAISEANKNYGSNRFVKQLLDFISTKSKRSLTMRSRQIRDTNNT